MRKRTGRTAALTALLAAGALMVGAGAVRAQTVVAGTASGNPGDTVTLSVTLQTGSAMIAGTQNDFTFDAMTPVAATSKGKPDCTVNADIDKTGTSFGFLPPGCAAGSCTGVRAIVFSTGNVDPIPDGSELYTCKINIAADATGGSHPVTVSGVILSDPNGGQVAGASGTDGAVVVSGGAEPTPTEVPAGCPAGSSVQMAMVTVDMGGVQTTIDTTLNTGGADIAGTQNDFSFPADAAVAATSKGKPDCTVNPDIDKTGTSFGFLPPGCSGAACTGVRAIVFSTGNVDPIPDKSVLFTCNVNVADGATGVLPFAVSGVILSDPSGGQVSGAFGCDGSVTVGGVTPPTNTPAGETETPTIPPPTATATPPSATNTPTNTVAPTNTPTHTVAPTNTAAPAPTVEEDGGCQIGANGTSGAGWLLLIPAVGLLVMRRRSR